MLDREVRASQPAEIRATGDTVKVVGHAAIFNERAEIGELFIEIVHPGAFTRTLATADVPFLINHGGLPLARTRSSTLILREDARGLYMESDLDAEDPDVRRIVPKMKRGDLSKMSFAFRGVRQEWDESGEIPVRHLHEVELYDVSIVSTPAYDGTDIALRSRSPAPIVKPPGLLAARLRMDLDLRVRSIRA